VIKAKPFIKNLIIALLVAGALILVLCWVRGAFTADTEKELFKALCDAFFITGALFLGAGLLIFLSKEGTFAIFSYGARKFARRFNKEPLKEDDKLYSYYNYQVAAKGQKKRYFHLVLPGIIFIIAAIIFLQLFSNG
jgi:hypothetical protein